MRLQFGECTLDMESRQLIRDGRAVRVTGKALHLLEVLVRSRPRALSKQHLMEQVWPDVFVATSNLADLVAELRKAMGDDARRPTVIRTVYGFGYAFAAEARELAREHGVHARWRLRWGGREVPLSEGENVLGRGEGTVGEFEGGTVSRRHARIVVAGSAATLVDLGSKNGTFLRGRRITTPTSLADGDEILLGTSPVTVRFLPPPLSTRTAAPVRGGE
jgi:DNA-binding winged helix-turn-helix (wHTH) protein